MLLTLLPPSWGTIYLTGDPSVHSCKWDIWMGTTAKSVGEDPTNCQHHFDGKTSNRYILNIFHEHPMYCSKFLTSLMYFWKCMTEIKEWEKSDFMKFVTKKWKGSNSDATAVRHIRRTRPTTCKEFSWCTRQGSMLWLCLSAFVSLSMASLLWLGPGDNFDSTCWSSWVPSRQVSGGEAIPTVIDNGGVRHLMWSGNHQRKEVGGHVGISGGCASMRNAPLSPESWYIPFSYCFLSFFGL